MILLSGSRGYIGSKILDFLTYEGIQVVKVKRVMSNHTVVDFLIEADNSVFDKHSAQLDRQIVFINASSVFSRLHLPSDVLPQISGNIGYPASIVDFLLASKSQVRFINLTSYWKFYHHQTFGAKNFYSSTQNAFDQILHFLLQQDQFSVVELVLGDVFGSHDKRDKLIPSLLRASESGQFISIREPFMPIEPVFVDDVCRAVKKIIESPQISSSTRFDRVSIFGDDLLLVRDVVNCLEHLLQVRITEEKLAPNLTEKVASERPWRSVARELQNFRRTNLETALNYVIGSLKP